MSRLRTIAGAAWRRLLTFSDEGPGAAMAVAISALSLIMAGSVGLGLALLPYQLVGGEPPPGFDADLRRTLLLGSLAGTVLPILAAVWRQARRRRS